MGGLQSIARELGISESEAASGAAALAPAVLGGLKKQVQAHPQGLSGLAGILEKFGGGGLLDQVLASHPTDVSQGNEVLGQIFGSKDVSRTVAQNASAQSGLAPDLLKKMLPMLAMAVTGYMARQHAAGGTGAAGGLQGVLGGLLGGREATGGTDAVSPGLASVLDLGSHGNPLDDILRMTGKVTN
ncbi:MAG: DUF937 domain-containing protein, partial [Gemmatimonadota bacterium]